MTKLTREELTTLLQMLELVNFKGVKSAERIILLRDKLVKMIEEVDKV